MYKFLLCAAVVAALGVSGCHPVSGPHSSNPYILSVVCEEPHPETGRVVVHVELDARLFGVLFLYRGEDLISINVILSTGEIDLGVVPPGIYKVVLQGFNRDTVELITEAECMFDPVDGPPPPPTEVCDNGVDDDGDGLIDAADPDCAAPPPPPPPTPTVTCNANEEGGAVVVISFNGYEGSVTLVRSDDADDPILVTDGDSVLEVPLKPGRYTFELRDESGVAFSPPIFCEVIIPDDDDDHDDNSLCNREDLSECEARICALEDHNAKYVVQHKDGKGRVHQIIVSWHALRAHICVHGDELGVAVPR